jgi:hypothetical protein
MRRARERSLTNPLSTGEGVGLAVLGLAVVGGLIWWATSSSSTPATPSTPSTPATPTGTMTAWTGNGMVPAAQATGATPLATACVPGTPVFLYDTGGNQYAANITSCTSSGANVTISQAGGSVLSAAMQYTGVPLTYLSST